MNLAWLYSLEAVFLISLASFSGALFLTLKKKFLQKIIFFLVSLAAGNLLGGALLHLLPELVEKGGLDLTASLAILGGILLFFFLETFVRWHHCHDIDCQRHPRPLAIMSLVGDGLHNFLDGIVIAASFSVSRSVGVATTVAVFFHEVPQEIGDLGVLIHAGLSRRRALLFNFLSALTAILGVILFFLLEKTVVDLSRMALPVAIGGFIYIAGSDLIPELKKETDNQRSLWQFLGMVLGILIMLVLRIWK